MTKRILIVSSYFPPEKGAASNRIFNMASSISKLEGSEIEVLCPLPNYPEGKVFEGYRGLFHKIKNVNGIKVFRIWTYASNSKNAVLRLLSMVSFGMGIWFMIPKFLFSRYDKVIIQSPPLISAYMASVLFRLLGVKIYLNISDLWPMSAFELGVIGKGKFYSTLEWIEKKMYSKANFIIGQSNEIINHIDNFTNVPKLLYRNLPKNDNEDFKSLETINPNRNIKILYAGLIGAAQGIIDICKNVNFVENGFEFHIYGMGNEVDELEKLLSSNPNKGIFFHGALERTKLIQEFKKYDISLIPLKHRIHGAVPSKLFEMISFNIPILFMGGGEGAKTVSKYKIGNVVSPNDFEKLNDILKDLNLDMLAEYQSNLASCRNIFSYKLQEEKLLKLFK